MPKIVDTTIRLLSQEPLAGKLPTGEVLRIAEILDGAGFAYLEVSGGGVFDSAVRRAVESPWERIRAIDARTTTPLGLALRGRFLVGSRPVSADIVRRFVSCAADNGIDVFRLHDPLNDVSNLREAGRGDRRRGKEFHVGLVYSAGREGRDRRARRAGEADSRARGDARDRQRSDRRAAAASHRGARAADREPKRACRWGCSCRERRGRGCSTRSSRRGSGPT